MKNKSIEFCENKYPVMTAAFKEILNQMYTTFCEKQHDYGPTNISLGRDLSKKENKTKSLTGVWFRSNDKLCRVDNLLNNGFKAKNESLEDSFLDLANYSVISLLVCKDKWEK